MTDRHQENTRIVGTMAAEDMAKRYRQVAQELQAGGHSQEDQLAVRIIHVSSLYGTYQMTPELIAYYLGQEKDHIQTIIAACKKTGKL